MEWSVTRDRSDAPGALVYRWDLDKTYLKSEFDTLRELVRIPFEKATEKVAAPGVTALIRALRAAAEARGCPVRVFFVSASPPQIGGEIERKLQLDGIVYDGIVFKDQLQHLMRGKFRALREHVGFKLTELLAARQAAPVDSREFLFGDDWESDPIIYSLYADVIAGRIGAPALAEFLRALRVEATEVERAVALAGRVVPADAVAGIFINLERRTPPVRLRAFGPRLVPTFNYFQTALCLWEAAVLDDAGLAQVAAALLRSEACSRRRLENSLADLVRRGHLGSGAGTLAAERLRGRGLFAPTRRAWRTRWRAWWEAARGVRRRVSEAEPVDYPALVRQQEAESNGA